MTGNKIKELRIKKGLTQSQLSEGFITRNMLSQIENNLATPSLSTLSQIAKRLDAPVEYFLSESITLPSMKKIQNADKIKAAFASGDYDGCVRLLSGCEDDESLLIVSMCLCEKGKAEFISGEFFSARNDFLKAGACADKSAFAFEAKRISEKYVNAIDYVLGRGDAPMPRLDECGYIAAIAGKSTYATRHIEARRLISEGKYEEAEKKLGTLLSEAKECGAVCEYYLLADLEACLKHQGEFERAYSCAERRLAISEKMNK